MELQNIGAFVDTFLDGEKEGARRLIQHEMESMIDPLVESLFGQLKVKLVDYLDATKGLHGGHQHQNDQESVEPMVQDREMIVNTQQYHSQSVDDAHSIDASYQINPTNHLEPMVIKEEIDDPLNVQPQLYDDAFNLSSSAHESSLFSMNPSTSTDQSLPNTQMQPQTQQQFAHIKHNQFDDEEECDCDECVYGGIEVKEEDDEEDSDDEQEDGDLSRSLKRARIDSTQPDNAQLNVIRQSTRQSTDEAQANEYETPEDESDQMGSVGSQDLDTQSTIEHYDHGQHNDESMVIQQNQKDTNNAIQDQIANKSTTNPIQPNLAKSNRHFQCPQCPQSFYHRCRLEKHLIMHTGERPFACVQCGKGFRKTGQLTQHQLYHQNIKPFHCDQCDKQFVLKFHLDSHLRTHSGERPYKCRFCDQCFMESSHRKSHEQAIHLHVKPYRCKVCGLSATVRSMIIRHIRVIHFGLPATIKEQRKRNIIDERDPRELVEKVLVL